MARRPSDKATERRRACGGFTLAEMMVAVGILIVVIAATAKIFGTVSKVTGIGIAGADVLQEAAAIERQLRADFQRLTPEGYFAIRCVAVPNDFHLLTSGRLLNPSLRSDALIRADQLLFFTTGVQSIQTFRQGAGSDHKGQATAARVYYGHAFQVPQGPPAEPGAAMMLAIDPPPGNPLLPWSEGSRTFVRTEFHDIANGDDYTIQGDFGDVDVTQPPARRWLLARQSIALAHDGGDTAVYLAPTGTGGVRSTRYIDDLVIRHGRVDAAAQQINDVRRFLGVAPVAGGGLQRRPWLDSAFTDFFGDCDQRTIIAGRVFYPRAERVAPSMHRVDQALTAHVLATACSSFVIDWTYENGVGEVFNARGRRFAGVQVDPTLEQPWFGLDPTGDRGVQTLRTWLVDNPLTNPDEPIFPENIEGPPPGPPDQIDVYEAFFGFNRGTALALNPSNGEVEPLLDLGYTPWPTAIRITMTLHDADTRLEKGRVVQFVIDLPKRVE